MRVLFVLKQIGYVRHFDTVIGEMADRGHVVRVACQDGRLDLPEALAQHPTVSAVACPKRRSDEWGGVTSLVRRASDYVRYLEPPFEGARKLRARAFEKMVHALSEDRWQPQAGWSDVLLALGEGDWRRLREVFALLERAIPSDPAIEAFIAQEAPDVVVITPLVDLGSAQTDLVKAAQRLHVPVAMALFSWDNLSTKGRIHVAPDRILAWNRLQQQEVVELHGLPADLVRITGAPRFDSFFALRPVRDRAAFCQALGFDPARPIVVYLGSSPFVSADEREFVGDWVRALRSASDAQVRDANLLVKPHPDLNKLWSEPSESTEAWEGVGRVLVTKPYAEARVAVLRSKFTAAQLLYECLSHAHVAVGLNTSAELEAGIVGLPVLTIEAPGVADGQQSTLHFHYLLDRNGGFVRIARTLDEHVAQLAKVLDADYDRSYVHRFIQEFLRPHGIEKPATPVFVREVERLAQQGIADGVERETQAEKAKRQGLAELPAKGSVGPRALASETEGEQRVLLDYPRASIWLTVSSPEERRWRGRACAKEPFTVEWIESHVHEGDVLYDVGANVGAFSFIAAKHCRQQLTIVAFEPGYATFAHLCDNIVLNGCDRCIIPVPLPLASRTGLAGFQYRSLHAGQSRHVLSEGAGARAKKKADTRYRQPVLAVRLDDLVSQYELPAPTHIKLDVDGGEVKVLEGAPRTLSGPSLRSILVEVDQNLTEPVQRILETHGFRLAKRYQREKKPNAPWYGLFER